MNTIKDNCLFWIYLASAYDATLKELSSPLGTYNTESVSIGDSYQVGAGSQKAGSGSVSVNTSLKKRSLLLPEVIGKLSSPDRLAIMRGLEPMIVRLTDISTMEVNKWLGLGDKEHNKKIQLERNTYESLRVLGIEKK